MAKAPSFFRAVLQVSDLDRAANFYSKLLDDEGRRIPRGSRHYFDCGPVILALVDVTAGGEEPKPIPDYIYFAVPDLEKVHEPGGLPLQRFCELRQEYQAVFFDFP